MGRRIGDIAAAQRAFGAIMAQMILYTYSPWLVALSVLIALMASFTGLSLTRGLSAVPVGQRQARIVMAAVALGGGIWSMHFVAMLAMRFDVPVHYEVIETVASALIAILLAGLALIIMHFGNRTRGAIVLSGGILGVGIVAMHYVGLSAIQGCAPQNGLPGVVLAGVLAILLGIAAIAIAYGNRTKRNIVLATLVFGAAVAIVHFCAMGFTTFLPVKEQVVTGPVMENQQIALYVVVAAFAISGAFLLTGATFLMRPPLLPAPGPVPGDVPAAPPMPVAPVRHPVEPVHKLPFEREGRTHLVPFDAVCAIQAEGHYTTAWMAQGPVFCPWSITQAEERVPPGFMRVHRSWLVNLSQIQAYERAKDHGYCLIGGAAGLVRVPVSRARVSAVREQLGL